VPADPARRDERCAEVYDIQVEALRSVTTDAVSADGAEGPVEAVVAVRSRC
jgi:hypothetical protein